MKEFEKWLSECYDRNSEAKEVVQNAGFLPSVEQATKEGWKAALEFALKIASENQDDGTWHMLLDELEQ